MFSGTCSQSVAELLKAAFLEVPQGKPLTRHLTSGVPQDVNFEPTFPKTWRTWVLEIKSGGRVFGTNFLG